VPLSSRIAVSLTAVLSISLPHLQDEARLRSVGLLLVGRPCVGRDRVARIGGLRNDELEFFRSARRREVKFRDDSLAVARLSTLTVSRFVSTRSKI